MKKTIMAVKTGLYNEWMSEERIYFEMTLDEFMERYDLNQQSYQFLILRTTKGDIIINKNYIISITEVEE